MPISIKNSKCELNNMTFIFHECLNDFYFRLIRHSYAEYSTSDLKKSAVVFSPHFDDEILGCGGTIIKKVRSGAVIKLVFMTDGSKSHNNLIAEAELKKIRKNEALAVIRSLTLSLIDVFFLDFEETMLNLHFSKAVDRTTEILLSQQPDEIFVPYHGEPNFWSLDHLMTYKIVMSALEKYGKKVVVYEYPIWLWYYQPFATLINNPKKVPTSLKHNFFSRINLLKDFRCSVYIGDVLEEKRKILNLYKSQMSRLVSRSNWQTLSDVANGRFLKSFFQDYEIFSQSTTK